jgi:hypothetical protein
MVVLFPFRYMFKTFWILCWEVLSRADVASSRMRRGVFLSAFQHFQRKDTGRDTDSDEDQQKELKVPITGFDPIEKRTLGDHGSGTSSGGKWRGRVGRSPLEGVTDPLSIFIRSPIITLLTRNKRCDSIMDSI